MRIPLLLALFAVVGCTQGTAGGAGSQCSQWEIVVLMPTDLKKGTSVQTPSPETAKLNDDTKKLVAGFKGGVVDPSEDMFGTTKALPKGWEPFGTFGVAVMARRCVK